MRVLISDHARFEAERREIPISIVLEVAQSPQQETQSIGDRTICQSRIYDSVTGKEMLYRVIVRDIENTRTVITVYKTSKIEKYWMSGD